MVSVYINNNHWQEED